MYQRENNELSVSGVSIGYTRSGNGAGEIFSNISASAGKGELVALFGKNGIGKSTLLRSIIRLQKPLKGKVFLSGKEISEYPPNELARKVSFVSTEPVKVNNMGVRDMVAFGRFPYTNWMGRMGAKDSLLIERAISMVGLNSLAHKNINNISDGERQRVMIARTLAQDTPVIVLDEPTAFLDLPNKYEIVHLLGRLASENNKTVVFSTHDLNIAIQEADKVWLMLDDKLIEGAPEDLVLDRSFGQIFSDSKLTFNDDKGEFRIAKSPSAEIALEGEGKEYFWTSKALERLEFKVVNDPNIPMKVVIDKKEGEKKWKLLTNQNQISFDSLYCLCSYLKSLKLS